MTVCVCVCVCVCARVCVCVCVTTLTNVSQRNTHILKFPVTPTLDVVDKLHIKGDMTICNTKWT
jgi:hypothetical protein